MKYEVLIYAGSEVLLALDVDGDKMQYISMDGNQSHPADDVNGFYENILDYFNVDDLSELKAGVRIINGGTSKKNIEFFNKKFIKVDDFSLWRTEELLPITVLQKSMIERNETITVSLYDRCYVLTADSAFNISVEHADEADKAMILEDFTLMNNFNGSNFHSNSDEVKKLRSELYEYEKNVTESNLKIRALEQKISSFETQFKALIDNENKYRIGAEIEFGNYNGESLRWTIIRKSLDSIYILCNEIICEREFDDRSSYNRWDACGLRKWLNEDFYNSAFSEDEKNKIESVNKDNVVLLTYDEAQILTSPEFRKKDKCWWLRSACFPGSRDFVWCVYIDGSIQHYYPSYTCGVRPALNLKFSIF